MPKKKRPIGCDLVDETPDYTKSAEENEQLYRERYLKVFGVYPDDPSEQTEDQSNSTNGV